MVIASCKDKSGAGWRERRGGPAHIDHDRNVADCSRGGIVYTQPVRVMLRLMDVWDKGAEFVLNGVIFA